MLDSRYFHVAAGIAPPLAEHAKGRTVLDIGPEGESAAVPSIVLRLFESVLECEVVAACAHKAAMLTLYHGTKHIGHCSCGRGDRHFALLFRPVETLGQAVLNLRRSPSASRLQRCGWQSECLH